MRLRLPLCALLAATVAGPAVGQTTYTWNGTGTDWSAGASWTPAGPPTAADIALFSPSGFLPFVTGTATPTTINQPALSAANTTALAATFAPTPRLGGWTLTGGGNALTLGGTGSTGLTTRSPGTTRLTGVGLTGASSTNNLQLNVGGGSELLFDGSTTAVTNLGTATTGVNLSGTLTLDGSGLMSGTGVSGCRAG